MERQVCKYGLNAIWVSGSEGSTRMCGWSNMILGNLTQSTIEELWHGENARAFRESMLDGSYRYCNKAKCPHCANDRLEEQFVKYEVPEYPTMCNLGYEEICNYICKFCRLDYHKPQNMKEKYQKIETEINKILPHLKELGANGAGEIFCSEHIIRLLKSDFLAADASVLIETNGSLFNEENWEKIKMLGNRNLTVAVTVHSFEESTYRYLSGTRLPVSNILNNLTFISRLRRQGVINKFEIATVLCERNFREMPDYVKKCLESFDMDTIRLRFFEPYGVMDVLTEWFYDVRNKLHPYHDEFVEVMKAPILQNEKVWRWQGDKASLQAESPYELEHRNVLNLSTLIGDGDFWNSLKAYMSKLSINTIALYGASKIGRAYRRLFTENGIEVSRLFDTYETEKKENGFSVLRPCPENFIGIDCIIITSNTFTSVMKEELARNNFAGKIISMDELINDIYCR